MALHHLAVDKDHINNFCDFISIHGASIECDDRFIDKLLAAQEASKALFDKGLRAETVLRDFEPDRLELAGFDYESYRQEFDFACVDHRGSVSLWYVVGEDDSERIEVVIDLNTLVRLRST